MVVTKILARKGRLDVSINYIFNGDKTQERLLTAHLNCDPGRECRQMCADVCIHDTDGHNPHAHIMLTVRPLTKDGKWQHKTEKEYLCIRDGEERGFTAVEFKSAQAEGWEKQCQYKVGRKNVYMTPSKAEAQGAERVSKYPKSTKYGRQNPITALFSRTSSGMTMLLSSSKPRSRSAGFCWRKRTRYWHSRCSGIGNWHRKSPV